MALSFCLCFSLHHLVQHRHKVRHTFDCMNLWCRVYSWLQNSRKRKQVVLVQIRSAEGYARTKVIGSRTSFVIASIRSSLYWNTCMYLGVIRSRSTAYSKVTIQHSYLNRENVIQNQKYSCKNNIKLLYLTFIHCARKLVKHKLSVHRENYNRTFHYK